MLNHERKRGRFYHGSNHIVLGVVSMPQRYKLTIVLW